MKLKVCNGCQRERPIYKNRVIDGVRFRLCKECNFREDLRVEPTKHDIAKRTEKKKLMDKVYSITRKKYLEEKEYCQAVFSVNCTHRATEIHHSSYRTGDNYLDRETWIAICRACHQEIHSNPIEAREKGLLK